MNKQVKALLGRAKAVVDDKTITSPEEKRAVLDEIDNILENEKGTPWWVIALKVLAYAIGLILAGFGTSAAAATLHVL